MVDTDTDLIEIDGIVETHNTADYDRQLGNDMIEQSAPYRMAVFNVLKHRDLAAFIEQETGVKLVEHGEHWSGWCPLHDGTHSMSFGVTQKPEGIWVFKCLAGDTRVITYDGVRPISELAGGTHKILTSAGAWVDAPFFDFGKQPLWRLTVSRNGRLKKILATEDHRWLVRRRSHLPHFERKTTELRDGDRLAWAFPKNAIKKLVQLSPQGIQHGVTFGDGTLFGKGSCADLIGKKDKQLLRWFPLNHYYRYLEKHQYKVRVKVVGLPAFFKKLPSIDESPLYLAGFLAGWLAADGHVDRRDACVTLVSASKGNLEFARLICQRLGVGTYGISKTKRLGFGKKPTWIYQLFIISEDLDERFFLLDYHRSRFVKMKKAWVRRGWVVKSVCRTNRVENVYCAKVEDYHSFALEDNILTGNCLGCGVSGTIIDFWMALQRTTNPVAAALELCDKLGLTNDEVVSQSVEALRIAYDSDRDFENLHLRTAAICHQLWRKFQNNPEIVEWVDQAYRRINQALKDQSSRVLDAIRSEAQGKL